MNYTPAAVLVLEALTDLPLLYFPFTGVTGLGVCSGSPS